jgi:hypothetical protein
MWTRTVVYVCMYDVGVINLSDKVLYGQLHLVSPETSQYTQSFQRSHVRKRKRKLSSVRVTTYIHRCATMNTSRRCEYTHVLRTHLESKICCQSFNSNFTELGISFSCSKPAISQRSDHTLSFNLIDHVYRYEYRNRRYVTIVGSPWALRQGCIWSLWSDSGEKEAIL